MAELATLAGAEPASQLRRPLDVRVRRVRRPADFGASRSWGSHNRGSSCAGTVGEAKGCASEVIEGNAQRMARCSSIPAIGTTKSDEEAVARAKMTAVAALQRLFF